jgi:quercetin dioxygenase-like cupin family protein
MKQTAVTAVAVLLFAAAPAAAQDATVADAKHYEVIEENDQVRVLHISYGPGEKSVMHKHPDAVFVALTDNHLRMQLADGETIEMEIEQGQVMFTPAVKHAPENLSDHAISGYLIELKHSHGEHAEHMEHQEHSEHAEHTEKP